MMADDFGDDEVQELLREIGVELGGLGELAQARDLLRLARRVGGRQAMRRLELAHGLRALEALGEQVNERCTDIVDAVAQALQFRLHGGHGWPLSSSDSLRQGSV